MAEIDIERIKWELRQWTAGWVESTLFQRTSYQRTSMGEASADQPLVLDWRGKIDTSFLNLDGPFVVGKEPPPTLLGDSKFAVYSSLPKTTPSKVHVANFGSSDDPGQLAVRLGFYGSATDTARATFIESAEQDISFRPLALQPSGGDVGIGTIAPAHALHVAKNTNSSAQIAVENVSGGTVAVAQLGAYNNANQSMQAGVLGSAHPGSGPIGSGDAYVQGNLTRLVLRTLGPNPMIFATDDVERMRILYAGQVGIGTATVTDANSKVEVRGGSTTSIRLGRSTHPNLRSDWIVTNTDVRINSYNDNTATYYPFYIFGSHVISMIDGAEAMRVNLDGRVGIGTASPNYELHVVKTQNTGTAIVAENPSGNTSPFAYVGALNNTGVLGSLAVYGGAFLTSGPVTSSDVVLSANPSRLVVRTLGNNDMLFATNNAERMRILGTGNVGIGAGAPSHNLHIYSNAAAIANVGLLIQNANATGDARLQFTQQSTNWAIGIDASLGDSFSISPSTDLSAVTGVTVKTTGYTGINTTAPGTLLQVGTGTLTPAGYPGIHVMSGGTTAGVHVQNSVGQQMGMFTHSNGNNYMGSFSNDNVIVRTNNADRITILATGQVGIGRSPSYGLDNNGQMRSIGLITASAGITFGQTTLNYYDEGTWTPVLDIGSSTAGIVVGSRTGTWTRIGNRVFLGFNITLTNKGTNTGTVHITGLPFTGSTSTAGASALYFDNMASNMNSVVAQMGVSSILIFYNVGMGHVTMTGAQLTNTSSFMGNIQYII